MRVSIAALMLVAAPAFAQGPVAQAPIAQAPIAQGQLSQGQLSQGQLSQAPVAEELGSWRLGCVVDRMTDRAACQLRHRDWVERPGGTPGLALEIQDRGGRLVPVVTARDLGLDGASRGLALLTGRVQMRLGANPMFEMRCGLEGRSLFCFPGPADAERVERDLATADRLLVRLGGDSEPKELRLDRTRDAMAAYRRQVPPGAPMPEGNDLGELLGRLRGLFQ